MKHIFFTILPIIIFFSCQSQEKNTNNTAPKNQEASSTIPILDTFNSAIIISYKTSPNKIQFFLKDDQGDYFNNHGNLKQHIESKGQALIFAMNGGMYLKDYSPQGLYIENRKELKTLNTKRSNYGNFYLEPNGVFFISKGNKPAIIPTKEYVDMAKIKFATQSGPMLLIKGKMHTAFTKGSKHIHIRNGVGILPNGELLFAMSKDSINFYDFASYFAKQGCKNALYLDGAISKTYLPAKGVRQLTGSFGVIIAEVKKN